MNSVFPTRYSTLDGRALGEVIEKRYKLGEVATCRCISRGESDSYEVVAERGRYIARVYRRRHSAVGRVASEHEFVLFLRESGVPVAAPLKQRDDETHSKLSCAEGLRRLALFEFAEGRPLQRRQPEDWIPFGRSVALAHVAAERYAPKVSRPPMDSAALLDEPVESFCREISHLPDVLAEVQEIAAAAKVRLEELPLRDLPCGWIHGDCSGSMARLAGGVATLFGFMWCGPGWYAYDLGAFRRGAGEVEANWEAFLDGYRAVREPRDIEIAAAPMLAVAHCLWDTRLILTDFADETPGASIDAVVERQLRELRHLEPGTR